MKTNLFTKCAAGLLLLASTTLVQAMPAKRGQWQTLALADGTTVTAQLMGNEHLHYYQTADGEIYTATETDGVYQKTSATLLKQRVQWRSPRKSNGPRKEFGVPTHYTGSKKGIIILVNYKDVKFNSANTQTRFNAIANQENYSSSPFTGSVHDYFLAQSYNQFDLTFDVVGPVQLANNQSYYGADSGGEGNDIRPGQMVKEACQAVNSQVTWSDYDWDGDGEVDQVFILYAGKGQADGGSANTIWPHEWEMTEAYGSRLSLQGTYINTYACGPELNGSGQINGIGTICHEFTHCLGVPDFYDTGGSYYSNYGMGSWSLMDYGCYNNNGYTPCDYTGYERWFCGWIDPIVIEGEQTLEVQGMKPISSTPEVYMAYNPANENEYYMLQNIKKEGWNAYAPGSGLLVMHVDYSKSVWQNNTVNTTSSRQRCTIVAADNSLSTSSESGDCYPYGTKKSLGNTTTPAAKLYNSNSDGTKLLNVEFTNITKASNGTISFKAVNNNPGSSTPDPDPDPDPETGDVVFYESFDQCNGTGGNDGKWSGSVASATFHADNDGWLAYKSYGGNQCARFGASTSVGQLTMPAFTMPAEGEVVLTFMAAPWAASADGNSLVLEVVEGDVSLSESDFTLTSGQWTECSTTITGSGTVQLRFTPIKRWFLDEVKVSKVKGDVTGIAAPRRPETTATVWCDLSGRRVATATRPGIYVVNGRKVVRK